MGLRGDLPQRPSEAVKERKASRKGAKAQRKVLSLLHSLCVLCAFA
jgi:hypothetical protein